MPTFCLCVMFNAGVILLFLLLSKVLGKSQLKLKLATQCQLSQENSF